MNGERRYINKDDNGLFREIGSFMRAKLDIEDVKNDPSFNITRNYVKEMISDYNKTVSEKINLKVNEKFIKESLTEGISKYKSHDNFTDSKAEIRMLTADWVKEWHRNQQMKGTPDPKAEERKDFITASLKAEPVETREETKIEKKKGISRSLLVRYISLSAAAVIGVVILLNTLLPSSTENLFNSYYTPFNAISPVTRNASNGNEEIYSSAINNFKAGDYKSAVTEFSEVNLRNPATGSPLFYMGLSNIELGNFSRAVSELSTIAAGSGEYVKEAQWYLGLAYIKTGEKLKAAECFEKLAQSPGFYHNRSEKILRRLK
jgi:tetratricopeptide (TPR) repeat protein